MAQKYYAYYLLESNEKNIVDSWDICQIKIKGKKVRYKSFKNYSEAQDWLDNGAEYLTQVKKEISLNDGIYFDAGTGRGIGVEVRVTDKNKNSLLFNSQWKERVNEYGNICLGKEVTNNYGELVGLYLAIKTAVNHNIFNIYGDSNLVIQYWSNGQFHRDKLNEKTVELIERVVKMRKNFEKIGGRIEHISGDINPADLGFHK